MQHLSRAAIGAYVVASKLGVQPSPEQLENIARASEGHPLALALIVEQLTEATDLTHIDQLLS